MSTALRMVASSTCEAEAAAVAVICFEWLQRPENVIAGHIRWSSFRTGPKPTIRIEHHKTGEIVDHPLEDDDVKFYEEAEGQPFIAALRQALQLLGWSDGRKIGIDIRWGENDVGLKYCRSKGGTAECARDRDPAYGDESPRKKAAALGAAGLLTKPTDF